MSVTRQRKILLALASDLLVMWSPEVEVNSRIYSTELQSGEKDIIHYRYQL